MNGYKDDHMKFSFMDPNKKVAAPSLESWLTSLQLEELEVPRPLCVSMVIHFERTHCQSVVESR